MKLIFFAIIIVLLGYLLKNILVYVIPKALCYSRCVAILTACYTTAVFATAGLSAPAALIACKMLFGVCLSLNFYLNIQIIIIILF